MREYLNERFPQPSICHIVSDDEALLRWSSRYPEFTPYDFFLWGFIKGRVFVPPLAQDLELRELIIRAFTAVTGDMVILVSEEIEFWEKKGATY